MCYPVWTVAPIEILSYISGRSGNVYRGKLRDPERGARPRPRIDHKTLTGFQ
jgi:hypothetical protein